mgnify:CR=1 FL=1
MSDVKNMKFYELVDHLAGNILKGLIAGEFRSSVSLSLQMAIQWQKDNNHEL